MAKARVINVEPERVLPRVELLVTLKEVCKRVFAEKLWASAVKRSLDQTLRSEPGISNVLLSFFARTFVTIRWSDFF